MLASKLLLIGFLATEAGLSFGVAASVRLIPWGGGFMTQDAAVLSSVRWDKLYSKLLKTTLLTLALIIPVGAWSQATSVKAADTQEESSEGEQTISSDSGASLSQGFSVTEAVSLSGTSAWSAVASTGLSRQLDEMAVTAVDVGGSLSYRLSDRDSLSARLSYSAPTELVTAYPENYGIGDLSLAWSRRNIWSHSSWGSVSSSLSWRLPTSELSQRYTQLSSFAAGLTLRRPMPPQSVLRHLTLLAQGSVAFTPHQYDRRAMGTLNSPFSLVYSGAGTYNFYNTVNLTMGYAMQHRVEYDGYVQDIQTLSVSAVATLPEMFFLTGGYRWRNTVVTNDPFLDPTKTLAYLELSRAF